MTVGRAFMAIEEKQPTKALMHYDLAISKRMNSEDLYYFRAEAYYELGQLREALADLEKCLEFIQSPEIHAFQSSHPVRNGRFEECL